MARLHFFTLSALGNPPDGGAHEDARDLIQALVETGHKPVVSTEMSPAAGKLAEEWAEKQGYAGAEFVHREDGLAADQIEGEAGRWLRKELQKGQVDEVSVYAGGVDEVGKIAADLADLDASATFHHVTPSAIFKVLP